MKQVKLEIIGGESNCAGGECPTFYRGDDGEFYVQGYTVTDAVKSGVSIKSDEDIVRISQALVKIIQSAKV